jgi:adenosylmethionine-8-amino-7-oxononanoate aminotransferase
MNDSVIHDPGNWAARSRAHVWHPCTQMKDHEGPIPLIPIRSAEGIWLEGQDGRKYLDAISSWWTNIFGHRHPWIVHKLKAQLDTLDHVIFAGFTHEPAVKLAEALCSIAPPGLSRCFYADNGSAAVEVALKMSGQDQVYRAEQRLSRRNARRAGGRRHWHVSRCLRADADGADFCALAGLL